MPDDVHYHDLPPCKSDTPPCPGGRPPRSSCTEIFIMNQMAAQCLHGGSLLLAEEIPIPENVVIEKHPSVLAKEAQLSNE